MSKVFLHGEIDMDKLVQSVADEFGMTLHPNDLARIVRQVERNLPVVKSEDETNVCRGCKQPLKLCTKCMLWRKTKSEAKRKLYEAGPTLLAKLNNWLEDAEDDRPLREK